MQKHLSKAKTETKRNSSIVKGADGTAEFNNEIKTSSGARLESRNIHNRNWL